MTILVTGGAGFIGSHMADALSERGDEVILLDNLSNGKIEKVAHLVNDGKAQLVTGSVLDEDTVDSLVAKASVVYHLAAIVGLERVCPNPAGTLTTNIDGTRIVLEACRRYGVKAVIASSSETYGKNEKIPLSETDDTIIGSTQVPRWAYAVSKLADEHLAWSMRSDIPIVILRYFNSYGPRVEPTGGSGAVARFIQQAIAGQPLTVFGDGRQARSYAYVSDTVKATIAAGDRLEGVRLNIGHPEETTIDRLAEMVIELTGSSSEITHLDTPLNWGPYEETRRRVPDITKAVSLLGFRLDVDLRTGLTRTIDWMRPRLESGQGKVA